MIINIPIDIEKKIDSICISLPFSGLTIKKMIKSTLPTDSELEMYGDAEKIRIIPGDSDFDFQTRDSKSGDYFKYNFSCNIVDNSKGVYKSLSRFINKKIVLIIGTSTHRYQLGWNEQPANFALRETVNGFKITITGESYFPPVRQEITSFRSSI